MNKNSKVLYLPFSFNSFPAPILKKKKYPEIKHKKVQRAKASQPKNSRLPPTGAKFWKLGSPLRAW